MKEACLNTAKVVNVTDTCTAIEYPLGDKDINAVVIKINGRYPKQGRTVNEKCKELAYVIGGIGQLTVEGQTVELKKGAVVLIMPCERFFWEGQDLEIFMPCTPAWYPEQHKEVE